MGDSGSDGGKVVDAHAKVALIGEDRDRFDNWRSRVGGGGGVHILLPHGANARGAFLDLRNEAKFGTQCLSKIPGRRCICKQGADFAKGFADLAAATSSRTSASIVSSIVFKEGASGSYLGSSVRGNFGKGLQEFWDLKVAFMPVGLDEKRVSSPA